MARINGIIKSVGAMASKHSPELLTAFGIASMFTGVVMAVHATPKAIDIIKAREEEKGGALSKPEVVAAAWKPYIPTAVFCAVAVICFVGANAISKNRCAALTAAYTLSETALREYTQEVKEAVGEKKEQEIHTKVIQKRINKTPVDEDTITCEGALTDPDNERTRCYDAFTGEYFWSDRAKIDRAVNDINRMMLTEDWVSMNDFYDSLGRERTKLGDLLGWSNRRGLSSVTARYSSHLAPNGRPCLAFCFDVLPEYEYAT